MSAALENASFNSSSASELSRALLTTNAVEHNTQETSLQKLATFALQMEQIKKKDPITFSATPTNSPVQKKRRTGYASSTDSIKPKTDKTVAKIFKQNSDLNSKELSKKLFYQSVELEKVKMELVQTKNELGRVKKDLEKEREKTVQLQKLAVHFSTVS